MSTLPEPADLIATEPRIQTPSGQTNEPWWRITLLVAATFGSGMAMIVPMAYSLAVRLDELAPGRVDVLGYVLGIGSAATLILAPLTGVLSDRTRSRWGRRRPFTVLGMTLGVIGVPIMALAPTVPVLTIGWIVSTVGWGTAGASVGNWQADRLPPAQRGRVSGLTGMAMQISPVIGILLVGLVRGEPLLVFAIPAVFGLVLISMFVLCCSEQDSRHSRSGTRLTLRGVLGSYGFSPRTVPDFTWNWVGRFVFFLGLSLTTSFSVFLFAQRLELPVADVAPLLAFASALSIATAMIGSFGGGWLSDRWGRRKPLILAGAVLFSAGSTLSAFAHDLPMLVAGTLVSSLGIAVFSAVGQALVLDVLPNRETEAGRYMAINLFSQKIPGVISPLAAPLVLAIGEGANFTALYLAAAILAVAGGCTLVRGVRGIR